LKDDYIISLSEVITELPRLTTVNLCDNNLTDSRYNDYYYLYYYDSYNYHHHLV
jgi:hypothetical protein